MATQHRTTLRPGASLHPGATPGAPTPGDTPLVSGDPPAGGTQLAHAIDTAGQLVGWTPLTTLTAWCQTCGTDVEFAVPAGAAPADLAADERGCVWCGEALVGCFDMVCEAATVSVA
jgi:hypothetical protein